MSPEDEPTRRTILVEVALYSLLVLVVGGIFVWARTARDRARERAAEAPPTDAGLPGSSGR